MKIEWKIKKRRKIKIFFWNMPPSTIFRRRIFHQREGGGGEALVFIMINDNPHFLNSFFLIKSYFKCTVFYFFFYGDFFQCISWKTCIFPNPIGHGLRKSWMLLPYLKTGREEKYSLFLFPPSSPWVTATTGEREKRDFFLSFHW